MLQLVKLIGLLEGVEKIRTLLWDKSTQDANFANKRIFVLPEVVNNLQFFQNFEPANYTLDLTNKDPTKYFALSTGNVYRSKWDGLLYAQAQLVRNIGKGYLGDWDNETIWVKANNIGIEQASPTSQSKSIIFPLMFAGLLFFNK